MSLQRLPLLLLVLLNCLPSSGAFANQAQSLFERHDESIYQILIIEQSSGKKSAIGSGFQIDSEGLIATNFHVISEAVHRPNKYHIEYLRHDGTRGALSIVDFDVVHDLALVRHKDPFSSHLRITDAVPAKGDALYSLGNPLDLGMTIIEGTYNGLIEKSFYRKILFSGSLNPGMSGGPTLNSDGEVIGVNVATSGNQISFLVPVSHLQTLVENRSDTVIDDYAQHIGAQLLADQDDKYSRLLSIDWPQQALGNTLIAGEISQYFHCWGETQDKKDLTYRLTSTRCSSNDSIYIGRDLTTGAMDYEFYWLESDELNSIRFHQLYSNNISSMYAGNRANKDSVTHYQCHQDFTANQADNDADGAWKSTFCARRYKKYPQLYDVIFISAYVGDDRAGLVSHFSLSGISRDKARQFTRAFMENYQWQ